MLIVNKVTISAAFLPLLGFAYCIYFITFLQLFYACLFCFYLGLMAQHQNFQLSSLIFEDTMFVRAIFTSSLMFLITACSSSTQMHPVSDAQMTKQNNKTAIKYTARSVLPSNTVTSSGNPCVDNFNFLREAGSDSYQLYSKEYVNIGNGYNFLGQNKDIMGGDARKVYNMNLDVKLDTLCNKVMYSGFGIIKNKVKELDGI